MKQPETYNDKDIYEILFHYLLLMTYFDSQRNIQKLVIKATLCYDWKEVLKNDLHNTLNEFSEYVSNPENNQYLNYYALASEFKNKDVFLIKSPVFDIVIDDIKVWEIAPGQDVVKNYFMDIIYYFHPSLKYLSEDGLLNTDNTIFENNEQLFYDAEVNPKIKILNLSYWLELNKTKIKNGAQLEDLNFPGLNVLSQILNTLYKIGFLNYCLSNNKFDLNTDYLLGERTSKVLGRQQQKVTTYKTLKEYDDLQKLHKYLIEKKLIREVNFTSFQKIFSNVEIQENDKLEWLKSKTLLVYLIQKLRENDFISITDNHWQKTEYCFKNLKSEILKSTFQNLQFNNPKGHEIIDAFFD